MAHKPSIQLDLLYLPLKGLSHGLQQLLILVGKLFGVLLLLVAL